MAMWVAEMPPPLKSKGMVLFIPDAHLSPHKPYGRWSLVCFGPKRHYQPDGTCAHTRVIAANLRPWYRARTWFTPFGGGPHDPQRRLAADGGS